jgi:uncharacterized protein (TIGR02646 family)
MRQIIKRQEPDSLVNHRASANSSYDNYAGKDDLRKSLVEEQYGLCCYCMSRIRPDENEMKIEHWRSRSNHPELALHYSNLLGACTGNKGSIPKFQHCDTIKGDRDLVYNPANPDHRIETRFVFLGDGEIRATDSDMNDDLAILQLNSVKKLKTNRKAVIDNFKQYLGKCGGEPKAKDLDELEAAWTKETNGCRPEFYPVVLYFIRKKRRQLEQKQIPKLKTDS